MSRMPDAESVRLCAPRPEDIGVRLAHGRAREIARMDGGDPDHMGKLEQAEIAAWHEGLKQHPCAWIIDANERAVGEARLDAIDQSDGRARLAIGLFGERDLGRGIGRLAIRLVLTHAFGEFGLHRVDLRALAFNTRAIRCHAACGFVAEGREREAAPIAGRRHDDLIMSILAHEFHARDGAG